jgi:uncharacterized protein
MPYTPPPPLAQMRLADVKAWIDAHPLPPLARWHPPVCGDSAMRIDASGAWWHEGALITRPAMVRAFARLLARDEAGQHWLINPGEKLTITVEDAPLIAVDVLQIEGALVFRLNTDDLLIAGPDHELTLRGSEDAPCAYVGAWHGCEARLNRSTWAQLVDIALESPLADGSTEGGLAVESLGTSFPLVPAKPLIQSENP